MQAPPQNWEPALGILRQWESTSSKKCWALGMGWLFVVVPTSFHAPWPRFHALWPRFHTLWPCHDLTSMHHDLFSTHYDLASKHRDLASRHHDLTATASNADAPSLGSLYKLPESRSCFFSVSLIWLTWNSSLAHPFQCANLLDHILSFIIFLSLCFSFKGSYRWIRTKALIPFSVLHFPGF